ncbi:MAG: hypothetical protein MUO58_18470 [Anaerolineales bacterium]|nr:hypothetical protein [Anaerolineales bacterium]
MPLQSKIGTAPLIEPPTDQNRRFFIITLLIGILIGILLSSIATVILYNLGFFDQFYVCPAPVSVEACPPDDVLAPVCPTCMPVPTDGAKSLDLTPTPTFTATPDIGATATAACGSFQSQFPGTPCPDASSP